jgi:hypothetical protein
LGIDGTGKKGEAAAPMVALTELSRGEQEEKMQVDIAERTMAPYRATAFRLRSMDYELSEIIARSTFEVVPGTYIYLQVRSVSEPERHFMVTRDGDEITVVT